MPPPVASVPNGHFAITVVVAPGDTVAEAGRLSLAAVQV
jgi:hypothetical protein